MDAVEHKKFINAFQKEIAFVLDGTQTYILYDNENQDNLRAVTYDEKNLEEESKYYSSGVWFVCDNTIDSNVMLNERKYKKKVKFPDDPVDRFHYDESEDKFKFNSKMGDLR